MENPEQIRDRIAARFSGARIEFVANPATAAQHSLLLPAAHAREIATFLRDAPGLRFDYCSNVTGVDWPDRTLVEIERQTIPMEPPAGASAPGPATRVIEKEIRRVQPGFLEVVYHLYSMELKQGPLVIRLRTANRTDQVTLPSLTGVWRSCDFQEREVFDLFGVVFEGHPNLRRILMWDEFKDHPMRKDYVSPDDFEWEPTPHDQVLVRAKEHYPKAAPKPEAPQG